MPSLSNWLRIGNNKNVTTMHGRIFQMSSTPIKKADWASPEQFYENSDDFADYIGDEIEGTDRKKDIMGMADCLKELFDLDKTGTALIYRGNLDEFKQKWADAIHQAAMEITADNVITDLKRRSLQLMIKETHVESSDRFYINEWNGYADALEGLIEWLGARKFKQGKKLYIGAVIDFHW